MKTLRTREEIAKAINFKNDLAVVEIDVSNEIELCDEVVGYQGCKVRMDFGKDYYFTGRLNYWKDTKKLSISADCVCLSNSFTYDDIKTMLENRNAPIIKNGCKMLIVCYNSKTGMVLSPVEVDVDGLRPFVTGMTIMNNADWIETLEVKGAK